MTRLTLGAPSLLAASALLFLLAGCAPLGAGAAETADASVVPGSDESSAPDESSTPDDEASDDALPEDVLFRITATATAPGGAAIHLVETVHAPRAITPADAADLDANLCDPWRSWPGAMIQDGEISATSVSGTWPADLDIPFTLGVWAIFDGDFELAQAYCSPGWLGAPGSTTGRQVFPGGAPDSADGWATPHYGFATGADGEVGPADAVLSECAIELGPTTAAMSALAAAWPGYVQPAPDAACTFGG